MYPAQTSFIPVQVALTRWLSEQGWLQAWRSNYPYWYLGSTPYRYLTGPVMPGVLVGLRRLLPSLNWFELVWLVMGVSVIATMLGVYWLVRELGGERRLGVWAAGLMGLGWFYWWSFPVTDGVSWLGFTGLIFSLVMYVRWLKQQSWLRVCSLIIFLSLVLLTNSLMVPSLGLGMLVVMLSWGKWQQVEKRLQASGVILITAGLWASGWYGLGYWLQLLRAPSLAGKAAFQVGGQLIKLLPMVVAVSVAVVGGRWLRIKGRFNRFWFYWLTTFGWLSLFRLIADPDFWLDWVAYGLELQLGLVLVMSRWLMNRRKGLIKGAVVGLWVLGWVLLINSRVYKGGQDYAEGMVEYQLGEFLTEVMEKDEQVFLSGSTVFWLNSWFDVVQVRGGADQAGVNKEWRKAAWEIREGKEGGLALEKLKELGVEWLVVHGQESEEYYDDFRYPDKFEDLEGLEKVYDRAGDRVYRIRS